MKKKTDTPNLEEKLNQTKWKSKIGFEFYGVKIGFRLDDSRYAENLRKTLPPGGCEIPFDETGNIFSLITNEKNPLKGFYVETGNEIVPAHEFESFDESLFEAVEAKVSLALALIAPPKIFLFHAGALVYKNFGIIIPGRSRAGKTTLVRDFIKNGAIYYSDDCAVVDRDGFLYPYPLNLGVRGENERSYLPADVFGAETGIAPARIEYILFAEYQPEAVWNPQPVTPAQTAFRLLENVFYRASVRRKPSETLNAVTKLANHAKAFEGFRSDTSSVIGWIEEKIDEKDLENSYANRRNSDSAF